MGLFNAKGIRADPQDQGGEYRSAVGLPGGIKHPAVDVLVAADICKSKSDARRQVTQKAVKLDGQLVHDAEAPARVGVLQKGKRHFVRIV